MNRDSKYLKQLYDEEKSDYFRVIKITAKARVKDGKVIGKESTYKNSFL